MPRDDPPNSALEATIMDLVTHDYLLRDTSVAATAARRTADRAAKKRANDQMPDNKGVGWRKKINSKPKELRPLEAVGTDDSSERQRHHGWRKTIQASRPATPVSGQPTDDIEDTQGERVEPSTPRRDSKPKLTRYTSLFSSFKDTKDSKGPNFAEPWDLAIAPLPAYVDPKVAIQSVRTHMLSFSMVPIPLEHNSNLFRVFEDYHKMRDKNDHLDTMLQDTRQTLQYSGEQWAKEERRYEEEIRRLELLIARGTAGVEGVLNARQGTLVDRKHRHRKTVSNDRPLLNELTTQEQIDKEIRRRSQQVLLQRSTSPSSKMTAISRQFTGKTFVDLHVGTPPNDIGNTTLSRKVQSELNLIRLSRLNTEGSVANSSMTSGFSGGTGDPLPDEMSPPSIALGDMAVDCDAIIALRELGALVARWRGLDTRNFVNGLMTLLAEADTSDEQTKTSQAEDLVEPGLMENDVTPQRPSIEPKRTIRTLPSQPQLDPDKRRRRHFSFEPGEDQLRAWNEKVTTDAASRENGDMSESVSSVSDDLRKISIESPAAGLTSPYQIPNIDLYNASKIPSPVQVFGSVRREASISSLQSSQPRSNDGRHNSQSSILTAYRENQNANLHLESSSRSSSNNNLRGVDVSPSPKDRPGTAVSRANHAHQAAGQTSDQIQPRSDSRGGSPAKGTAKLSTTSSSLRIIHNMGSQMPEDEKPCRSGRSATEEHSSP